MSNTQAALLEALTNARDIIRTDRQAFVDCYAIHELTTDLDPDSFVVYADGLWLSNADAECVRDYDRALSKLEAAIVQAESAQPVAGPEYWQWRRKGDPWSLSNTFSLPCYATTEDSEVRPLYAAPQPAEAAPKQEAVTDERAEFEKWAKAHGRIFLNRRGEGYIHQFTMEAWVAWQARAALSAQPQQPAP